VPSGRGHIWVEPTIAAEVRYKEWTRERLLRQPVFLRLREDKPLTDCRLPEEGGDDGPDGAASTRGTPQEPAPEVAPRPDIREVRLSNLHKVFWPDSGLTKGDLVEYYRKIAPRILPYLEDRPVVLTRYPDGIEGKSFFQKDAPAFTPGWIRTERFFSEDAQRDVDVFICDDEETLLYLANSATIPLHISASRIGRLGRPDWCLLDLDPKEAPFADVIEVALAIRKLCQALRLPTFVKTSGQSGLHVLVPLAGQCTYEQCRTLAELIARTIAAERPSVATIERPLPARRGRVYIDFVQNGQSRLMAAPYCVRAQPGAPVSTPLLWSEVGPKLDPRRFTIRSVPARVARQKKDPLAGVLAESPDLPRALARLAERMRKAEK
jgi:bifunctional non-homologous end joining protein LigD